MTVQMSTKSTPSCCQQTAAETKYHNYTLLTAIKRLRINHDKERKVWLSLVNIFSRKVVCFSQQHMTVVEYYISTAMASQCHVSSRRKYDENSYSK